MEFISRNGYESWNDVRTLASYIGLRDGGFTFCEDLWFIEWDTVSDLFLKVLIKSIWLEDEIKSSIDIWRGIESKEYSLVWHNFLHNPGHILIATAKEWIQSIPDICSPLNRINSKPSLLHFADKSLCPDLINLH